jgi:hypothetical protein
MDEEEIMQLSPEERLKLYMQQMQESREKHIQNSIVEKKQKKEQRKKEQFIKKQKEHKFDIDPKSRPHWRLGERFAAKDFEEKERKYLPITDIHATDLYRCSHLIPRTYKFPEQPFKLTKNKGSEFGEVGTDVLTESGKRIIGENAKKFEDEVERRRQEEMKRKNVEFGPRWECAKTHGQFFSVPPADPFYYFEHETKKEYYQTKPFLRTSKTGNMFSYP